MKIDKINLEKLIVKNWTSFIDPRIMFAHLRELVKIHLLSPEPYSINSIRLTRCESTTSGLLIWIDYIIKSEGSPVNATSEFLLVDDKLNYIKSITSNNG
jgi:hypothetical protein